MAVTTRPSRRDVDRRRRRRCIPVLTTSLRGRDPSRCGERWCRSARSARVPTASKRKRSLSAPLGVRAQALPGIAPRRGFPQRDASTSSRERRRKGRIRLSISPYPRQHGAGPATPRKDCEALAHSPGEVAKASPDQAVAFSRKPGSGGSLRNVAGPGVYHHHSTIGEERNGSRASDRAAGLGTPRLS